MDKTAFNGIGEVMVTLPVTEAVTAGQPVAVGTDGTAAPCGAGKRFCGVALAPRKGFAAVQVGGFTELPCADAGVKPGWVSLTADGNGGVKKAGTNDAGKEYLVVQAAGGTVSFLL